MEYTINDSPEDLEWAWNMIIRMRELGYHFRLAWNCYAEKMTVTLIQGSVPRKDRKQWSGRSDSLYEAVIEASANWQARQQGSKED